MIYVGGEILKFGRQQIDLLLGGGFNAFGVATVKKNDIFTSKAIHSTFLEPGIGYRFYPDKQRYAMVTARLFYRFLNFDQDKKIKNDLTGNAIVFQLFICTSDHADESYRLNEFRKYK